MKFIKKYLPKWMKGTKVVPVVRLEGMIATKGGGLGGGKRLNLVGVEDRLEKAFQFDGSGIVALIINSPGGSPVQSRLIYQRIRDLADQHDRRVYVFVEDVAASGGYMIAVAGDEIIADPSSIIGSIGVISASFGFDKLIAKHGIDRRVYTAGTKKLSLDPFQPEKPEDIKRLKALQKEIHQVFIDMVRERRGDVLTGDEKQLFSGEFWVGGQALELGLIDRLDDMRSVMKERIGDDVKFKVFAEQKPFLSLPGMGARLSALFGLAQFGLAQAEPNLIRDAVDVAEEEAIWARYGL